MWRQGDPVRSQRRDMVTYDIPAFLRKTDAAHGADKTTERGCTDPVLERDQLDRLPAYLEFAVAVAASKRAANSCMRERFFPKS